MEIGLIIIGDEILSGRRTDKHFAKVLELLQIRGLGLSWVRYLGDDRTQIAAALRDSMSTNAVVFCCGGIGGTPDDHTRQAAALALSLPLVLHPEAAALIEQRCQTTGAPLTPARLRMAEFPAGAALIPNPYNNIAGFACGRHYFVPGFPVMAWPMIEWVLDQYYADHFHVATEASQSLRIYEVMEATLTPLMEQIEREFPAVKVFSLPSIGEDGQRRHIELGVKGDPSVVEAAFPVLLAGLAPYSQNIEILSQQKTG
ncbi:competence/damage-inducible protein A [Parvibium lacunae]|uniref:Competence/damage-inducible protein A n=1 Tax=Parvibium lacunae TaxID=1888893 RepID=A0A368L8C1_9BURK|nr:molybdopterin-binding protein [Parvibium lacunae]RCS59857.1 competence/damage-inducible protein A [Parvibium lacunae]